MVVTPPSKSPTSCHFPSSPAHPPHPPAPAAPDQTDLLQALVRRHIGFGVVAAHAQKDLLQRRYGDAEELHAIASARAARRAVRHGGEGRSTGGTTL